MKIAKDKDILQALVDGKDIKSFNLDIYNSQIIIKFNSGKSICILARALTNEECFIEVVEV